MAYDVAIFVMMATAIAGILYALRETAMKGVRYTSRTRVPGRPPSREDRPCAEGEALELLGYAPSMSDDVSEGMMATPALGAEWAPTQERLLKIRIYAKHGARPQIIEKREREQIVDPLLRFEEERYRLHEQVYRAGKTEFLRRTADSLNDLLTVMCGTAFLARLRLASEDPLQESLRTIEQSAWRAGALANRLVRLARTGARLSTTATDLREAVVRQDKILAHHGQAVDSMERRLRRLEEEAALKQERATEDEPGSKPVKEFLH